MIITAPSKEIRESMWLSKRLDDMTREELMVALYQQAQLYEKVLRESLLADII